MSNPILHMIGLAKKAGRVELGEEPVGAAARGHQSKLILVASDAADNTCRRAAHFCEYGKMTWLQLPFTKAELGLQVGRSTLAMLAITDVGFAATITDKLALLDLEKYGPTAAELRVRADRYLERQKEQRQHEKNVLRGKTKPWAVPTQPAAKNGEKSASNGKKPRAGAKAGSVRTPRPEGDGKRLRYGDKPRQTGPSKPQTRIGAAPMQKPSFPSKSVVGAKRFTVTRKPSDLTPRNEVASNDE